ncbi:hypothetical protein LIER_42402 [Lithospermum erythrorhizon]|uniref:Uncharacterized protein n=1 Tax=Lithospermum erythrorhizon TaxID=34254 RepID=A0AAV3RUU3_LITER
MARTKGGNVRRASSAPLVGEKERGEHVPLQTIPAQQRPEGPPTKSEDLGLPWKDDTLKGETSSKPKTDDQNMNASPTDVNTSKNPNLSSDTKINVPEIPEKTIDEVSHHLEVEEPSVKDTQNLTGSKSHSSADPTVADIQSSLKKGKLGGRIKRALRKSKPPTRHVPHPVKPTVNDEESEKSVDDDVVVVSETASRRRTRASAAAMKTKLEAAGFNEGKDKSENPSKLKELESEKKAKEKKKGKRPCSEEQKIDRVTKRRKGFNINEPTQEKAKDRFRVDDVEDSEDEDTVFLVKKKSKGKMKINDDRNRINNRRIAKGIDDVSTEGIIFNSEENEARWNSVCARKILPER